MPSISRDGTSVFYEDSGVGSEIPLGHGVVGVAARERAPIRIGHATTEYAYGRATWPRAPDHVAENLLDAAGWILGRLEAAP